MSNRPKVFAEWPVPVAKQQPHELIDKAPGEPGLVSQLINQQATRIQGLDTPGGAVMRRSGDISWDSPSSDVIHSHTCFGVALR